jgi:ABC-type oligopeptide transport system substrate-binding subunit
MRKMLFALLATLLFMGSSATLVATAQDDATPEPDAQSAPSGTNPIDPRVGDEVTFYTEDGDEAGIATVTGIERGWEEYDEFQEPEDGTEYVAFTITIESTISRGAIDVSAYDFSLQTAAGYLWSNAYASSETTEPPVLEDDVSLASGDSEEFTVIFQVYEDEELAHLFWQPDSGVLLTIAQLEGE